MVFRFYQPGGFKEGLTFSSLKSGTNHTSMLLMTSSKRSVITHVKVQAVMQCVFSG
jgi:hypothetical protein